MVGSLSPPFTHTVKTEPNGSISPPLTKGVVTVGGSLTPPYTKGAVTVGGSLSPPGTFQVATIRGVSVANFQKKYIRGIDRASMGFQFAEGRVQPDASGSAFDSHGLCSGLTEQGATAAILDSKGRAAGRATDGTLNDDAGWETNGQIIRTDNSPQAVVKFALDAVTSARFFVGLSSLSLTNTLAADDPGSAHLLGLQFSTARDTNIQLVKKDGTTLVLSDTGIAPAASTVYYLVVESFSASNINLKLLDSSLDVQHVFNVASGGPSPTQALSLVAGVRALASVVRQLRTYHAALAPSV